MSRATSSRKSSRTMSSTRPPPTSTRGSSSSRPSCRRRRAASCSEQSCGIASLHHMRPQIGICASLMQAKYGVWDQLVALTPLGYIRAVQEAGGLALLIPPDPELEDNPDEALDLIDGLVLAGGNDVDPAAYGETPHETVVHTVPARDRSEIAL